MTLRFSRNFWADRAFTPTSDAAHELALAGDRCRLHGEQTADRGRRTAPGEQHATLAEIRRDCCLVLPENYEPNYPYPLVVWLHAAGGSERDVLEMMPRVSTQNYIGLGLRGMLVRHVTPSVGYGWPSWNWPISDFLESLSATIGGLLSDYNIHSERIFPVGIGEGATMAMRLLLSRPEWFGGAIALGGQFPQKKQPLARFRDLGGKRILIGAGSTNQSGTTTGSRDFGRLLHAAGMDVDTRSYVSAQAVSPAVWGDVNRWLMDGIYAANHVS